MQLIDEYFSRDAGDDGAFDHVRLVPMINPRPWLMAWRANPKASTCSAEKYLPKSAVGHGRRP